jgi:DNA ligase (NAD+)
MSEVIADISISPEIGADDIAATIELWNKAYREGRVEDHPSDEVYNAWKARLAELQPDHPFLHKVEPEPLADKTFVHTEPMLGMDKLNSYDEVRKFIAKVASHGVNVGLRPHQIKLKLMPKLDGFATRIYREPANPNSTERIVTRGDGAVGNDLTHLWHDGLYTPYRKEGFENEKVIAGEVVVKRKYFDERLSKKVLGENGFANPRSAVNGLTTANTLRPEMREALRDGAVVLYPYNCLPCTDITLADFEKDVEGALAVHVEFDEYDIDGVVIEVQNPEIRKTMGDTSGYHCWRAAYKWVSNVAETSVVGITPQVGRTGVVTPVYNVKTVEVGGVRISNITGHNYRMMQEKGVGVGAVIEVIRAGEVIPHLHRVVKPSNAVLPVACPSCGGPLQWDENDTHLVCTAGAACPAQVQTRLLHFFRCLGVDQFGPATLDVLINNGCNTPLKVLDVDGKFLAQCGFGHGEAARLIDERNRLLTNGTDDWRLLWAMGIKDVGESTARNVCNAYSIDQLAAEGDRLNYLNIKDIGPVTNASLLLWMGKNKQELQDILAVVKCRSSKEANVSVDSPISGKTIVFTGTMKAGSRDEMQEQARRLGATVSDSVSKKTSLVVYGEGAGSKLKKAQDLGITALTEEEYYALLSGNA